MLLFERCKQVCQKSVVQPLAVRAPGLDGGAQRVVILPVSEGSSVSEAINKDNKRALSAIRELMSPSKLNAAARLVLIASRCGSELLYDLDRFDRVVGQGRFADLDREVLGLARRIVKYGGNNRPKPPNCRTAIAT
jgi:hypothetical protein